MEKALISVRIDSDVLDRIDALASAREWSRNKMIGRLLQMATDQELDLIVPADIAVRPIEDVEDVQGVVGSEPAPKESRPRGKPQSGVAPKAGGAAPCTHPKNRRENLGYSVKCGVCGEVLR